MTLIDMLKIADSECKDRWYRRKSDSAEEGRFVHVDLWGIDYYDAYAWGVPLTLNTSVSDTEFLYADDFEEITADQARELALMHNAHREGQIMAWR